jgi:hypothetical protein
LLATDSVLMLTQAVSSDYCSLRSSTSSDNFFVVRIWKSPRIRWSAVLDVGMDECPNPNMGIQLKSN